MEVLVKRIIIISILIMLSSLLDLLDNLIISALNLEDKGIYELIVDIITPIIEISLLFWALITGKNIICKIKDEEEQYKRLVQLSPAAIIIHDSGNILFINEMGANLFGLSSNELINRSISEFIHYDSMDLYNSLIENGYNNLNNAISQNIKIKRVDGAIIDLETNSTKIDFNGQVAREVIARDITIQKGEMENVKRLAYQDELTGLPNRRAFMEKITQMVQSSDKTSFALLFIDLDGFKQVNDTLGHKGGDILLQEVSDNFRKCVAEKGIVARLAGDEFVILHYVANEYEIVARTIRESLGSPFNILGREVRVTPSIGIALYPQHGQEVNELLMNADSAMYQAKQKGKNYYRIYQTL